MKNFSLFAKFIFLSSLLVLLLQSGCQDKSAPESRLENPYIEVKIGNSVYTKLDVYNHIYNMLKPFIDKSAFFVRWPRNFKFNCWILGLEDVDFKMEIENKFSALLNSIPLEKSGSCYDPQFITEYVVLFVSDLNEVFESYSWIGEIIKKKGMTREEFIKKYENSTYSFSGFDKEEISAYLNITHLNTSQKENGLVNLNRILSGVYSGIVPYANNVSILDESIFSNNEYIDYQAFDIALLKAWYSNKITPGISLNKAAYKLTNEVINYFEMENKK